MFHNLKLEKREYHQYRGTTYEIAVYRDISGDLRGYVSAGGFGDNIAEMSGETASDMKIAIGVDPVECLVNEMKNEIDAGNLPLAKPIQNR
jgi:hypothetical protein